MTEETVTRLGTELIRIGSTMRLDPGSIAGPELTREDHALPYLAMHVINRLGGKAIFPVVLDVTELHQHQRQCRNFQGQVIGTALEQPHRIDLTLHI